MGTRSMQFNYSICAKALVIWLLYTRIRTHVLFHNETQWRIYYVLIWSLQFTLLLLLDYISCSIGNLFLEATLQARHTQVGKAKDVGPNARIVFSYLQCTRYRPYLHSSCTRVVHSSSWTSESYGWFRMQGRQSRSVPSTAILQSTAASHRDHTHQLLYLETLIP